MDKFLKTLGKVLVAVVSIIAITVIIGAIRWAFKTLITNRS